MHAANCKTIHKVLAKQKKTLLLQQINMPMKRISLIILSIILTATTFAQRHEFGIFAGGSYYLGDLNESKQFGMINPAGGLVYRYAINPRWALKFNAHYGSIAANDKITNPDMKHRNLHFKSTLADIGGQLELNFLEYVTGSEQRRFAPFIFLGFSVFRFNPKAEYDGKWYELQPLGTEGQGTTRYPDRKPYSLTSVGIPFGFGFKFSIGQNTSLALEWGLRKTFTDYLDDVSTTYADPGVLSAENSPLSMVLANRSFEPGFDNFQNWGPTTGSPTGNPPPYPNYPRDGASAMTDYQRGNSQNMDWYSLVGFTITFKIQGPKAKTCPAYQKHFNYKDYYIF